MIQANTISKAVEQAFKSDPNFNVFNIERSEYVNEDPSACPWIGIYRSDINYDPETLGNGPDHWTGKMLLRIIVQSSSLLSGEAAEDELDDNVAIIISKIFEDTTIRQTVDMVNSLSVTYSYTAEEEESMYFQSALIELTLEVSTS